MFMRTVGSKLRAAALLFAPSSSLAIAIGLAPVAHRTGRSEPPRRSKSMEK